MQISSFFTQFPALASASLLPYAQSAPTHGTDKSRDEKVAAKAPAISGGSRLSADRIIDELHLSDAALAADEEAASDKASGKSTDGTTESTQGTGSNVHLSEEQQREVQKLRQTDQQVRRHEQAHLAAAGSNARGGPTFEYEVGPDNRRYAVGGEVQIDTSSVPDDPEATIQKARSIRAASLAPSDPSAQDRSVAAAASKIEADARRELAEKERTEDESAEEESSAATTSPVGLSIQLTSAVATSSTKAAASSTKSTNRLFASGQPERLSTAQAAASYQGATKGQRLDLIA